MRIDVLSAVPALLEGPFSASIVGRAQKAGIVEVVVHDIRKWSTNKHKKIDDPPYGGEAGMVMAIQPIVDAIAELKSQRPYDEIIFLTPDGPRLEQGTVNQLSMASNLLLLCGHYKGIDQRIRETVITREISIGDYVLSGGELAAAVLTDAIVRLVPGAIGDGASALTDSFQDGLLAPPVYTRPSEWNGLRVPEVLLGGDHAKIEAWKAAQALERTRKLRPDLIDENPGQDDGKKERDSRR